MGGAGSRRPVELCADFREHVDITEGPGGLYRGVLTTAPRLSNAVTELTGEQAEIVRLIQVLLARQRAGGPRGRG